MTLDDGTPGLRRKLNFAVLGAAIVLIVLARACGLLSTRPPPDAPRSAAGAPQDR